MSERDGERGAVAVLMALWLPVLLGAAALGVGVLTLAGGERELQRAADAGALAAASQLPLVEVGAASTVGDLLPSGSTVQERACGVATANLGEARLTSAFATTTGCDAQALALAPNLVTALEDGFGVVDPSLLEPLNRIVDVAGVLPAIAAPHVEATVTSDIDPPLRRLVSPGEPGEMEATAVARRRFKNAVFVPAVDAYGECQVLLGWMELGDLLESSLLGTEDDCRVNANETLTIPRDPALDTLDTLADGLPTQLSPAAGAIRELRNDLADLYDPPSGPVPDQHDIIAAAAANNEDVLVIVAEPISGGGGLLESLIGASAVPILDVAAVPASELADGTFDPADAKALTEAQGIFRATLVEP